MKKKVYIFFLAFFASLTIKAQELTGQPAVVTITIESKEPITIIRGKHNYNIYKVTVNKVHCINVCEDFKTEFNEQYLTSCKYLTVCLDSSKYHQSKVDWIEKKEYTIEAGVGFGIADLPFYRVVAETSYVADPYSIKICSWPALSESIEGSLFGNW